MTLDEFIEENKDKSYWPRAWVDFDGFNGVYVRLGFKNIKGQHYRDVIDLANMTATTPGKGAFKNLVRHIRERYPKYGIHVENALTERFRLGLVRMGFSPTQYPQCFFLAPDEEIHL